ncbi:hypothetical protein MTO96_013894 [Rhipicephalus appendiculatus]
MSSARVVKSALRSRRNVDKPQSAHVFERDPLALSCRQSASRRPSAQLRATTVAARPASARMQEVRDALEPVASRPARTAAGD